ncbi:MAG: LPS export ABC transporter periplasmic protein LptC [Coleofasciculaceae cyanobacterium RL_1_1]|nr:LPS export ABC transporter periplasmic protein LptC [Coleofasciculaceae cyanobacterium RL_1_1]
MVSNERLVRSSIGWISLLSLLFCLSSCSRNPEEASSDAQKPSSRNFDPALTFNDVTLEQIDRDGKKRWSLLAQRVTYSKDRKIATASSLSGKLYNDGEYAYDAKAREGVLSQNGDRIVLTGEIEVVDRKDGTVFSADEVEWLPDDDRMIFKGNLKAIHEDGSLTAQAGELLEADRILNLSKEVLIETKDPRMTLRADRGTWQMDEEMVLADGNLVVERYEGEGEAATVADRGTATKGSLDLGVKLIILDGSAQLIFSDPPVSLSSERLQWDLPGQVLSSEVPLTIINRENQVSLLGQRGKFNVADEVLELTGGIEALANANQSRMTADNLTWFVATQTFNAVGNVVYRQSEPQFVLYGPQAEGKLEAQTFVVTGGDVVTEITPDGSLGF